MARRKEFSGGDALVAGVIFIGAVGGIAGVGVAAEQVKASPRLSCEVSPRKEGIVPVVYAIGGAAAKEVTIQFDGAPRRTVEPFDLVPNPVGDPGMSHVHVEVTGETANHQRLAADCEGITMPEELR